MVMNTISERTDALSSAGHRLGQLIGDWWEEEVVFHLLAEICSPLKLYLDNRIVERTCRSEKVQWADVEGNSVDYDYVIELGGSPSKKGIPVAFLESFWRRGARHSKDKARDDTNKLLPMRDAYPTARFLAIAACGEFTEPARNYVRSRGVELLFISKENVVKAFQEINARIDYPDNTSEEDKVKLVEEFEAQFNRENRKKVANKLREIAGSNTFSSFTQRIRGSLTATPQEIRIFSVSRFDPMIFDCIYQAEQFLSGENPKFSSLNQKFHYEYEVSFSDGSEFSRTLSSLNELRELNLQLRALVDHFSRLNNHET